MKKEEKEYYRIVNKVFGILAPFYDISNIPIMRVRDKVVNFTDVKRGSKILDVASGTGGQAIAFAKKGYDVIGIDLSKAMLKIAKKKNKYKNLRFEVADATNLPYENNSFDVSCVSFALHEMPFSIRKKALKEMMRVTKPKGMIIIVDYGLPENKIWRFIVYNLVKLYERYYPEFIRSGLKELLRELGIKTIEEYPVLFGSGRILKGIKK